MVDYLKNILTLSGGTLVSQLIFIISIPIITRIYSPSDLGVTAFFLAVASILSSLSTGKYDLAIFLPKNRLWVQNLFFGTILINIFLSVLLLLLIIPIKFLAEVYFDYNLIWYLSIPLLFFLNGLNASANALLNKNKIYKYISISRILRNIVLSVFSIFLGLFFYKAIFIIISHIISLVIMNSLLIYIIFKKNILEKNLFNYKKTFILLKRYYHFPLYSLPSAFINILSNQAPIIMLSIYFGPSVSGMYSLVNRAMGAPSKLISSATSEVFRQKASEEYRLNNNCKNLYLSTFKGLLLISCLPFSIIIFFGPELFSFFFGEPWLQAGYYARYLSIFYILRFCISPLGFTLIISNRQDYNLYWQIILLVVSNIGLFIGYYYNNVTYSIIAFSVFYSIMYVFYFKESYKSSKGILS